MNAKIHSQLMAIIGIGATLFSAHTFGDWSGTVVSVKDGDTLEIMRDGHGRPVRLVEIDAPELSQPYGQQSKQSLSRLAYGKWAAVTEHGSDKYRRALGRVHINGIDVNAEQVRRGLAWAYRKYLTDPALAELEQEARSARTGIWADVNPIPPWEFRHPENAAQLAAKQSKPKRSGQGKGGSGGQGASAETGFSCGTKRYCKDMSSCAEARYYMTQCGRRDFDRDGDGAPCENVCGKR